MSEVISLRERVAQAELAMNRHGDSEETLALPSGTRHGSPDPGC